jgi:cytochrome c5
MKLSTSGKLHRLALLALAVLVLAPMAWAELPPSQPTAPGVETASGLTELQSAQLGLVCARCHARPGSGAPLMGDLAEWARRSSVGFDVLLARTVDGWQTMPPLGTCGSCTEEDFRALVSVVSGVADPGGER